MSKSLGQKIGIKFTEDLVGDVSGNESAFSVTGQQYKYINGVLIDGDYQIDKIERYPIQSLWNVNFQQGILTDTEISPNGLTLGVIDV